MRLLAGEALGHLLHGRHTGHTTDEHQLINLAGGETGGGDAALYRAGGTLQQVLRQLLQFAAGQRHLDVLGTGGVHRDERQHDVVALGGGKGDLGLLCLLLDALQGVRLLGDVHALAGLELCQDVVDDGVVPVITAQVRITVRGLYLEHAVADLQHGNIEGTAAEVVHGDLLVALLVQTVSQGRSRRLVDDTAHLEARDLAGSLGGVTLCIVEVGRHGNDGLRDGLTQLSLGVRLQLGQHHSTDLLRGVDLCLAAHLNLNVGITVGGCHNRVRHLLVLLRQLAVLAADESLGREDRVARVGDRLTLGRLADDAFAVLGEGHDGRGGAGALAVLQHGGLAAFHHSHAGIGRS